MFASSDYEKARAPLTLALARPTAASR